MRVKTGLRGQKKRPLPRQKAQDAVRPRVPVTLWLTKKPSKTPKRRGPTLRPRGASPRPHSGEGRARSPIPASARSRAGPSSKKCAAAKQKRGKGKTRTREAQQNPCRLASQEKGPQKGRASSSPISSRRIPKTPGAQNGAPKKRQEAGRTAKKGETTSAAGHKNKKGTSKKVRVGVSCYYLICIS